MSATQLESFLLLTLVSLSYSTSLRRIERLRRAVTLDRVPDMLGVWTFAGAVLLPPPLIAALVIAVNLGEWPSRKAVGNGRPLRYAVSTGGTATWCIAASMVLHARPGFTGICLGIITFCALSAGFVAVLMYASGHRGALRMMCNSKVHAVEVGTQALGAGAALLMQWQPTVVVLALPCLYGAHLAALRHAVKQTSSFDPTSGLWSEDAWAIQARDCIDGATGCVLLVLVDPDLPGCEPQIGTMLAETFGSGDAVGRYGTRQVVMVSRVDLACVGSILAGDTRAALREAGIVCQVGATVSAGEDLDALLLRAGQDLMKRRESAGVSLAW